MTSLQLTDYVRRTHPIHVHRDLIKDTCTLSRGMTTGSRVTLYCANTATNVVVLTPRLQPITARSGRIILDLTANPIGAGERMEIVVYHADFKYTDQIMLTNNSIYSDYNDATNPLVPPAEYIAIPNPDPTQNIQVRGGMAALLYTSIYNSSTTPNVNSGTISSGSLQKGGVTPMLPIGQFTIVIQNIDQINPISDFSVLPISTGGDPDPLAVRTLDFSLIRREGL